MPAEIKLQLVRAVAQATERGMSMRQACEVLMLDPRRLRRWIRGRDTRVLDCARPFDRKRRRNLHAHRASPVPS